MFMLFSAVIYPFTPVLVLISDTFTRVFLCVCVKYVQVALSK